MTKTAAMHFGGPAAAASGGHHGGMGGSSSGSGMGVSGGGGSGSSTSGRDVKPHQCQQCLKTFSSNHQLVQHIRVHTGEKPYKCSYCDRRFKQLSHVQQHTRLHTGKHKIFSEDSAISPLLSTKNEIEKSSYLVDGHQITFIQSARIEK